MDMIVLSLRGNQTMQEQAARLTLPTTKVLSAIGITSGGAFAATPSPFHPLLVRTSELPPLPAELAGVMEEGTGRIWVAGRFFLMA